jgi:hippurate hydrolase
LKNIMNKALQLPSPIDHISTFHAELTAFRRDLHAHPELGFEEVRTASVIEQALNRLGIETHSGIGKTGLVGVIKGKSDQSGRTIGLRADMDALPMKEDNQFEYRSTIPGRMHGCGHDGHSTMLLGAARYLAETRNFDGTVHLIFQPGEEGFAGARAMIEDGLFERFDCQTVYAMHNWPSMPPGTIGINNGPMMAAADRFEVHISGRGGHGAHPYLTIDPVLVAAHIITAAQSIISRNVSPLDSAVVSVCAVESGELAAMNVIPGQARLTGTVRTFRATTQDTVERRLGEVVQSIAAAFGASATLDYRRMYPATINSEREAIFAGDVAEQLVGAEHVLRNMEPSMGAEDFSFMLQVRPGAYFRLGQGGAESGCFLHNTRYDFNDAVIPLGSGMFAALAERSMPL